MLEGEKKYRANAYFKKKFMVKLMGWKKIMPTTWITQPSPPPSPCPLRSKMIGPWSDLFYWREPLQFNSRKKTTPESNHLILSFWMFSFGTFDCSTSYLIGHIKNSSACFKIALPIFHGKWTCFQGILYNKDPLDFGWFKVHVSSRLSESFLIWCPCGTKAEILSNHGRLQISCPY